MKDYIRYKAGSAILQTIGDEGLDPRKIRVFAGAAGGPKWFVCVGFDHAMIESGFLGRGDRPVLLVGSSAGAWRCMAMACPNPLDAYERLRIGYSRNIFTAADTPASISAAFRKNIEDAISDEDVRFILDHDRFALGIHVVRSQGWASSSRKFFEGSALAAGAVLNLFSPRFMQAFYERILFYSGDEPPSFVSNRFRGRAVRLTTENFHDAALATGSLPYIMAGVPDITGAPPGVYRDGGLLDYQFNQDYDPGPDGMTLFFHYQERIVPGWLDKKLRRRKPPAGSLDRVLQVYPGDDFLAMLADGRLPDRQDFIDFVNDPAERIRRWDEAAKLSRVIGDRFLEDVESGKIRELVRPLE